MNRRVLTTGILGAMSCALVCCNYGTVSVQGKIVQNGERLKLHHDQKLNVVFYPYVEKGNAEDAFPANAFASGYFEVPGKKGKGLPPGKYRISVRLPRGHQQDETIAGPNSPIIREVTGEEIVIDLAKPTS